MSDFAKEKDAIVKAMVAYKVDGIKNAAEAARKAGMPATAIIDAMGESVATPDEAREILDLNRKAVSA